LGSFTGSQIDETLYSIEIDDCVKSDFARYVLAVFNTADLTSASPKPKLRVEHHESRAEFGLPFIAKERRHGVDILLRERPPPSIKPRSARRGRRS
jgi:hypothetical protein